MLYCDLGNQSEPMKGFTITLEKQLRYSALLNKQLYKYLALWEKVQNNATNGRPLLTTFDNLLPYDCLHLHLHQADSLDVKYL